MFSDTLGAEQDFGLMTADYQAWTVRAGSGECEYVGMN